MYGTRNIGLNFMMYLCDVIGTMHVLHVVVVLFNEFPVVFLHEKFGMYGTRCKHDK